MAILSAAARITSSQPVVRAKKKKKRRHRRSALSVLQDELIPDGKDPFDLVEMNDLVENLATAEGQNRDLPEKVWEEWMWNSNLNEPPDSGSLLNRCQLLGLLICRYRAARQPPCNVVIALAPTQLVVIQDKPPGSYTLRELRDSLTNLILLWGKNIHAQNTTEECSRSQQVLMYLDACFHRLGEYTLYE